jgi:hypothetical protein
MHDFPGQTTGQRGVVVSLRDEFPHFDNRPIDFSKLFSYDETSDDTPEPPREEDLDQMNNVLTILRTGSDRG